jgi:putative selenate reductase molybdopterin-binding subunit
MFDVIGKRTSLINGTEKITGSAIFTSDLTLPRMLYGMTLKSPLPHGRIVRLDVRKARELSGVAAVITAADIPNNDSVIGISAADMGVLSSDKVRFIGDEIAAIAAIDEITAEEALELIEVDYKPLPAVFTMEDALRESAPRIHHEVPPLKVISGNTDKGFEEADYIIEESFETQPVEHAPPESEAVVAHYDGHNMTVWATTQVPYWDRAAISRAFGLPLNRVKVIIPHIGGAFGGRNKFRLLYIGAALSWKAHRPVKMVRNSEEEFVCSTHRNPYKFDLKFGVKKDGSFTAMSCRTISDAGAYLSWAFALGHAQGNLFASLYKCQNIQYLYSIVFTNNPYNGPMRGFGNSEINFAVESMMDIIAKKLRMDPVELRLNNAVDKDYVTPIGWRIRGCALKECIQKAAAEIRQGFSQTNDSTKAKGIGLACGVHWCGWRVGFNSFVWRTGYGSLEELYKAQPESPFIAITDGKARWREGFSDMEAIDSDISSCILTVNEDGTTTLSVADPDLGQGSYTALAMIAAEELGISVEDVEVVRPETNSGVFGFGTYASRVLSTSGKAVQRAAAEIKRRLADIAAEYLEANPSDLGFRDKKIYVKGSPNKFIYLADAAFRAYFTRGSDLLSAKGCYDPESIVPDSMGHGSIAESYAFFAQAAEIEVNRETGEIRVLRIVASHDSGRIINPLAAEGQVEGAIVQGVGYALSEILNRHEGRILNPNFANYRMVPVTEVPEIKTIFVEREEPSGPFGAKGIGEPGLVCTLAAIANALDNALGIRVRSIPMNPEKILPLLYRKSKSQSYL